MRCTPLVIPHMLSGYSILSSYIRMNKYNLNRNLKFIIRLDLGICLRAGACARRGAIRSCVREALCFIHRAFDHLIQGLGIGNPLRFYCTAVLRFDSQKQSSRFSPCGHINESPHTDRFRKAQKTNAPSLSPATSIHCLHRGSSTPTFTISLHVSSVYEFLRLSLSRSDNPIPSVLQ